MKREDIPDILSDLICKDYMGLLTPEQKEELEELCRRYQIPEEGRERILERFGRPEVFDVKSAYGSFSHKARRRVLFRRLQIAAMILLVLGAGSMAWWMSKPVDVSPVMAVSDNIQPGNSKAVITLSNGETIELENLSRQLKEMNGTVIEAASGELKYSDSQQSTELIYNTISIPRGGEYRLTLSDGTRVWLNAESQLKYPVVFNGDIREVSLTGEAYFEVAHNEKQPFYVSTTQGKIRVLGTSFNVRDYQDEGKVVTVLETGKVRYRTSGGEEVDLMPGYMLEHKEGKALIPQKVNTRLYTAWKDGKYIFEEASVEEIMSTLERWYNVRVIYLNNRVKHLHFTGDLERYSSFNTILRFIETGGDVTFQIDGNTIIAGEK